MANKRPGNFQYQNNYKKLRLPEEPSQQQFHPVHNAHPHFQSNIENSGAHGTVLHNIPCHTNQQLNHNFLNDYGYINRGAVPFENQAYNVGQYYNGEPKNCRAVEGMPPRLNVKKPSNNSLKSLPMKEHNEFSESKFIRLRSKSMHLLSGSVENVLLWSKMVNTQNVLFEIIGKLDYIRTGRYLCEKAFMLRGINGGPSLQVVFYEIDRPLFQFEAGSLLKVVGHMKSRSRLQAFTVIQSTQEEVQISQHIYFICDRAAQELAKIKLNP